MKRKSLLFGAALLMAAGVMAQTDVTPANWKFSNQSVGSAAYIYAKDGCALNGNLVYNEPSKLGDKAVQTLIGFRYADNMEGAIALSPWIEDMSMYPEGAAVYGINMTDEHKAIIDNFIGASQIVQDGTFKDFCYQGNASTASISGAVKNTGDAPAVKMNIFTNKITEDGTYRFTMPIRVICNDDMTSADLSFYTSTAWYDPLPLSGSGKDDGANTLTFGKVFNDDWTVIQFELDVKAQGADATVQLTPVNIALGLGALGNQSIILFRDFKLEKVPAATCGGELKYLDDYFPTSIEKNEIGADVIVYSTDNAITVIDANAPIEVYTTAGTLVNKVEANNTVTTIPVAQKGIYLVKVGATTKKVVF